MKPEKKKGRGIAGAFIPPPPKAAPDVTATPDPMHRKREADADDELIRKSDSAMNANSWLIPGGKYLDAQKRKSERSTEPVLSTMDKYGVQDIVRELSEHPTPAEAQSEFERLGGSGWKPPNPRSTDLARKRKLK